MCLHLSHNLHLSHAEFILPPPVELFICSFNSHSFNWWIRFLLMLLKMSLILLTNIPNLIPFSLHSIVHCLHPHRHTICAHKEKKLNMMMLTCIKIGFVTKWKFNSWRNVQSSQIPCPHVKIHIFALSLILIEFTKSSHYFFSGHS